MMTRTVGGRRRSRRIAGSAIAAVVLVAACGGTKDSGETAKTSQPATSTGSSPKGSVGPGSTTQGSASTSGASPWAAQLDGVIPKVLADAKLPGAIVGIWQDGKEPYVKAFGVRDTATNEPMSTSLHTRIGSNTKSFTVTAVLQLVDKRLIGLDDPIAKYIDGVPNGQNITIRHLAAMRSGIYNYADTVIPQVLQSPEKVWTAQELLAIGFGHPPLFAPGTAFDYSNTNTVLLGQLVEKVSGQSLAAYFEEHIFEPEGLSATSYPAGTELPQPYASGYTLDATGKVVETTRWSPTWGNAAGAMISTLDDLRVWTRDLATGKLLSPSSQEARLQFQAAPPEDKTYGLGIENDGGWIGHGGNILGYISYPFYLPTEGITMVVLLNSSASVAGSVDLMQAITKIVSPDNVWPAIPEMPPG